MSSEDSASFEFRLDLDSVVIPDEIVTQLVDAGFAYRHPRFREALAPSDKTTYGCMALLQVLANALSGTHLTPTVVDGEALFEAQVVLADFRQVLERALTIVGLLTQVKYDRPKGEDVLPNFRDGISPN